MTKPVAKKEGKGSNSGKEKRKSGAKKIIDGGKTTKVSEFFVLFAKLSNLLPLKVKTSSLSF